MLQKVTTRLYTLVLNLLAPNLLYNLAPDYKIKFQSSKPPKIFGRQVVAINKHFQGDVKRRW